MAKKNNTITLTMDSLANTGAGVGRVDGMAVFVPLALPGEQVQVRIIKQAKSYCIGKLQQVLVPSAKRCEPACGVYPRCGGCNLQHLEYAAQLENKKREAEETIRRISGIPVTLEQCYGMAHPYHYRNKALLPVGKNQQGDVVIGFYSSRSHNIVDIQDCLIQSMQLGPIIDKVKALIATTKTSIYDEQLHSGCLRHILVRKGHATGDLMVVPVTNGPLPQGEVWAKQLLSLPGCVSVINNINTSRGNIVLSDQCVLLGGKPYINDQLCGIGFTLSALSFLQVNAVQAERLYQLALEFSGVCPQDTVLDAYCGIGIMTQLFAGRAKRAIGVEIIPDAIENARHSAKSNGISNVEFITGDCAKELPGLLVSLGKVDCLVVDPPRAGCESSLLEAVGKSGIERIVYISCDVATLARDMKLLSTYNYTPVRCAAVDMFPQTTHVETVVLMSRKI